MNKLRTLVLSFALIAIVATNAFSEPLVSAPLPSNAYITKNGYDWAWIFAVSPTGYYVNEQYGTVYPDFSYQAQFGWRLPTVEEMQLAPTAMDFVFSGANVPLGGSSADGTWVAYSTSTLTGDLASAVAYFVNVNDAAIANHCDWANAPGSGGGAGTEEYSWWQPGSQNILNETLAIRPVPEPTTMLLFCFGLVGLAGMRRFKQ